MSSSIAGNTALKSVWSDNAYNSRSSNSLSGSSFPEELDNAGAPSQEEEWAADTAMRQEDQRVHIAKAQSGHMKSNLYGFTDRGNEGIRFRKAIDQIAEVLQTLEGGYKSYDEMYYSEGVVTIDGEKKTISYGELHETLDQDIEQRKKRIDEMERNGASQDDINQEKADLDKVRNADRALNKVLSSGGNISQAEQESLDDNLSELPAATKAKVDSMAPPIEAKAKMEGTSTTANVKSDFSQASLGQIENAPATIDNNAPVNTSANGMSI